MRLALASVCVASVAHRSLLEVPEAVRSESPTERRGPLGETAVSTAGGMMSIRMGPAKAEAAHELPPGHPGREALLCAPDEVSEAVFDAMVSRWVRLLRLGGPS